MANENVDKVERSPNDAHVDITEYLRKNLKKAVNWLLVPAAAGTIANMLGLALIPFLGAPAYVTFVAVVVVASIIAKVISGAADEEMQDDAK